MFGIGIGFGSSLTVMLRSFRRVFRMMMMFFVIVVVHVEMVVSVIPFRISVGIFVVGGRVGTVSST